jgi:hypothetical protein
LLVTLYATRGATLRSVTLDGKPLDAVTTAEKGHPMFTVDIELPPQATQHLVFTYTEPNAPGRLQVLRQPLVRPLVETVRRRAC